MSDGGTPGVGVMMGHGVEIVLPGGKRWKVGAPDQAAKARLEKLAAKVALDEVRRLKDTLDPAAYAELFGEVTRNLKSYRTWQPGWQSVVMSPAGQHLFLLSLMPDATEADVLGIFATAPEEVAAALAQVLPDFFTMLVEPLTAHLSPADLEKVTAALAALRAQLTHTAPST
jgi:hypothetical protein